MSTDNQDNKERRCVVWEQRKGGARFITTYGEESEYASSKNHILVEMNVSEETAKLLCDARQEKTIASYLDSLPEEMRDPRGDAFIANLIRNGADGDQ